MKKLKFIICFLLCILSCSIVCAQTKYDKAKELLEKGQMQSVIDLLRDEAKGGNAKYQFILGGCYDELGDMQNSIFWYRKAAENNYVPSFFNLALIFDPLRKQWDVEKDIELSKKYYLKTISSSNEKDKYWSVVNYAILLRKVENKKEEAIDFLKKYMNQDEEYLVHIYLCQLLLEDEDKNNNYREALKIHRNLAEKKVLYPMFWLGREYMNGKAGKLDKDAEEAIRLLTLVSENEEDYDDGWGSIKTRARRYLGYIYEEMYRKYNTDKYLRLTLKWCARADDIFTDDTLQELYDEKVYHAEEYPSFQAWRSFLIKTFSYDSDVDYNIPKTEKINTNVWVLIIANEHYELESPVLYAENDGRIFAKYCTSALGIPQSNVTYVTDCSLNKMKYEIDMLVQKGSLNAESKIIFYYAGHGIPADNLSTAYLLPIDGYARNTSTGLDIGNLYHQLGYSGVPSIIFLDACFSGAQRDGNMMVSSRGVAIKPKEQALSGNVVVMSACKGDETALQYSDQQHGLFTYYLLKKIQESQGDCTLGELEIYLKSKVPTQSIIINGKSQTPSVRVSPTMANVWQSFKFK